MSHRVYHSIFRIWKIVNVKIKKSENPANGKNAHRKIVDTRLANYPSAIVKNRLGPC